MLAAEGVAIEERDALPLPVPLSDGIGVSVALALLPELMLREISAECEDDAVAEGVRAADCCSEGGDTDAVPVAVTLCDAIDAVPVTEAAVVDVATVLCVGVPFPELLVAGTVVVAVALLL